MAHAIYLAYESDLTGELCRTSEEADAKSLNRAVAFLTTLQSASTLRSNLADSESEAWRFLDWLVKNRYELTKEVAAARRAKASEPTFAQSETSTDG